MKFFAAFIKKNKQNKIEDIALVREGFFWSAFFFSLPWFLFHKMWRNSLALILIDITLTYFEKIELIGSFDFVALQFFLLLAIGFNAGYWFSEHLQKIGYKSMGYVLAQNEDEARLQFMKILENNYQNLDFDEFADSYAKAKSPKKKEHYFA